MKKFTPGQILTIGAIAIGAIAVGKVIYDIKKIRREAAEADAAPAGDEATEQGAEKIAK